jgi:hypothetical protein
MSDSNTPPGRSGDRLGDRLRALRADTDRVAAPLARSIRHRGDRRTAVQVASTTLAAACVIGLGAVVFPLGGSNDHDPVETPSTPVVVPTLTEDVLLGVDDLAGLDQFTDWEAAWDVIPYSDPLTGPGPCVGPPELPPADQRLGRSFRATPDRSTVPVGAPYDAASSVVVFGDESTAQSALEAVRERLLACGDGTPEASRATGLWSLDGAGDFGFVVEVMTPESGGALVGFHDVAIARSGPVVVEVWVNLNVPEAPVLTPILDLLEVAVDRVCPVSGTTCAETITAERAALDQPSGGPSGEPVPPSGDGDPLLDLADLPTWNGVLPWDTSFDVEDVGSGPYGIACHSLWRDLFADSELMRQYNVVTGTDPGNEPSATEVVAEFSDEVVAAGAIDAVSGEMYRCQGSDQVAPDVTVDEIATSAGTAWLVTLPSSGAETTRVLMGIVRSGTRVAMITVTYPSADALPAEPFLDLLDSATERLSLVTP